MNFASSPDLGSILDIPESLINSLRKRVQGIPLHFDHAIFLN